MLSWKLVLILLLYGCGKPITESGYDPKKVSTLREGVNETILLNQKMYMNFDQLPLEGEVKSQKKYWSGDSWKLKNGSINYRWNAEKPTGRNYISPHPRELKNYSLEQLMILAPTEKYDLWMGRYDYPLKNQVTSYLPKVPLEWEGLCHGWAAASINHNEPRPKVLTNPDGVRIPFGSADIKALLTYYYSFQLVDQNLQIGRRCERYAFLEEDNCDEDVSPVNFHVVLANKLGLKGESFILDIDRYLEVWNHPLLSYKTRIMRDIRGKSRRVRLRTSLFYVDVAVKSSWTPTLGTAAHLISKQQLEYELNLTPEGNIIGGKWITRDRPDFIWTIGKVERFTGYLSGLNELIK